MHFSTDPASHWQVLQTSWPRIFTSRLNAGTKLVGPVISCQTIDWPAAVPEVLRERDVPHLSHDMLAFDKVLEPCACFKNHLPSNSHLHEACQF